MAWPRKTHGLEEILPPGRAAGFGIDQCCRANVKIEGREIISRSLLDRGLFRWRKFGLKLIGDFLGNLALDGKDIGQITVILFGPDMCVIACIY